VAVRTASLSAAASSKYPSMMVRPMATVVFSKNELGAR
jgi:hypothetical protein